MTEHDGILQYDDIYSHSWLSTFAKLSNAKALHFSRGGFTCNSFLNDEYEKKTDFLKSENECDAYFLALGTNDEYTKPYQLGSINDSAGTNSFVGKYKEIIELIHTTYPKAPIFLVTLYTVTSENKGYIAMIKSISELYEYCYCVDLTLTYPLLFNSEYELNGHFSSKGYVLVGQNVFNIVNQIINESEDFNSFTLKYK